MAEEAIVRRHWWVATLLGFVAPGLGQLYTGRARLAGYLIAAFVAASALFLTSIPATFAGFVLAFGGWCLVSWGGAIEAGAHAWRSATVQRRSYHRWYAYVAYGTASTLVTQGINMGLLASIGLPSMFGAYHPLRISSGPMEPGLVEGEYFLSERSRGATKRDLTTWLGSVVIVSWPGEEGTFVYRLVAVGGQSIAVRDRKPLVDGKVLQQKVICSVPEAGSGQMAKRSIETLAGRSYVVQNFDDVEFGRDTEEVTIPDDQFFVVGDTRENSNDSRFRGPVANENFAGRALFIFWSNDWRRIGKTLIPGAKVEASEYCPAATG